MIDDGAKNEILQAIAVLDMKLTSRIDGLEKRSDRFDARFDGLEKKMDTLHEEAMDAIQMLSSSTDERFNELDAKIDRTRAEMPTKDYLDRKFADYDKDASERAERTFVRR